MLSRKVFFLRDGTEVAPDGLARRRPQQSERSRSLTSLAPSDVSPRWPALPAPRQTWTPWWQQGEDSWVATVAPSPELTLTASVMTSSPVRRRRCISAEEHKADPPGARARVTAATATPTCRPPPEPSPLWLAARTPKARRGGAPLLLSYMVLQ